MAAGASSALGLKGRLLLYGAVPVEGALQVRGHSHLPAVKDAGGEQTRDEGSLVMLDGTRSSDPDQDTLTYT